MPGLVHNSQEVFTDFDIYITLNFEEVACIAGLEAVFAEIPVVGIQISPTRQVDASDWIWSDQNPKLVDQKVKALLSEADELERARQNQFVVANRDYSIARMRSEYLEIYTVPL